jgi:hypothetical protein
MKCSDGGAEHGIGLPRHEVDLLCVLVAALGER